MPQKNDDSALEELQQTLDTPTADVSGSFARPGFHRTIHEDTPTDWTSTDKKADDTETIAPLAAMSRLGLSKKHHTLAKWIFGLAVLFFVGALGVAAFFLSGNRNILSTDKIDITITGPTSISAGEVVPLAIEIKNNNNTTLQTADLLIEYPPGTRSAENVSFEQPRARLSLGDIAPGTRYATTTKAILFGEEKTEAIIMVSLEYRVEGSNAIFVKERELVVGIDDSPVSLSVDAPASIDSGNEIRLELKVRSNSTAPLENVIVRGEYPFGFSFVSSNPDPTFSDTVWSLGTLEPRDERSIVIRGTIEGQNDENRLFRFDVGVAEGENVTDIGTSFAHTEKSISIARPFVDLGLAVGGSSDEILTLATGAQANVQATWRNNLTGKLADAVLELSIEGSGVKERSITATGGVYDSIRDIVTWDKRSSSALAVIDGGDSGRVEVSLDALEIEDLAGSVVNPTIDLVLTMRGMPVADRETPEQVRAERMATIRLITDVDLRTTVLHDEGPLSNSGPIPPRVETETTYTIGWEVSSSVNDVSNAVVSATLPAYVSWKGVTLPVDEDITFDSATGKVTWRPGTIRAGDGYKTPARSISFQVGLIPSVNQVGSEPTLITTSTFSGHDGFADVSVTSRQGERNTSLDDQRNHDNEDGEVVK